MLGSVARLERGAYIGDVTALCAVPPPPTSDGAEARGRDTLLDGVGASVHWYDPLGGFDDAPALTLRVFAAARVHGIAPAPSLDALLAPARGPPLASLPGDEASTIAASAPPPPARAFVVFGERRVALVALVAGDGVSVAARRVSISRALPPLGHWVHDARPLRPDAAAPAPAVALGLADNAVELWTFPADPNDPPTRKRRVECAMRSMLYSLALRGDTAGALEVAGGTIFNEIQLWAPGLGEDASDASDDASSRPDPWAILRGHDGSVMRVTWASDFEDEAAAAAARHGAGGDLVFSTSDDRTARAWAVPPRPRDAPSAPPAPPTIVAPLATAYGHAARVWDCRPVGRAAGGASAPLLVTAGEDCAARLWARRADTGVPALETPVATLRGHRGRGIWRATTLRAPDGSDVLVTAGADASIKLWDLAEYVAKSETKSAAGAVEHRALAAPGNAENAAQTAPAFEPSSSDSGAAKVSALALASPDALFVGSTRGRLERLDFPPRGLPGSPSPEAGRGLARALAFETPDGAAIVSLARLGANRLALGEASGRVVILEIDPRGARSSAIERASWRATPPRRLLDVFAADGAVLVAEVGGEVRAWTENETAAGTECAGAETWALAGIARVPFRRRVVAAARLRGARAPRGAGLVVLGDAAGNVAAFARDGDKNGLELRLVAAARSAHGKHPVTLVDVRRERGGGLGVQTGECGGEEGGGADEGAPDFCPSSSPGDYEGVEITSCGRDGRVCAYEILPADPAAAADVAAAAAHAKRLEREEADAAALADARDALDALAGLGGATGTNPPGGEGGEGGERRVSSSRECSELFAPGPHGSRGRNAAAKKAAKAADAAALRVESVKAAEAARLAPRRLACSSRRRLDGITCVEALAPGRAALALPSLAAGFRETEFVVLDLGNQRELMRAACGGWHRPRSFLFDGDGGGGFAFAFCKGGTLALLRREGAGEPARGAKDASGGWNARTLNVWSHGCVPFRVGRPEVFSLFRAPGSVPVPRRIHIFSNLSPRAAAGSGATLGESPADTKRSGRASALPPLVADAAARPRPDRDPRRDAAPKAKLRARTEEVWSFRSA